MRVPFYKNQEYYSIQLSKCGDTPLNISNLTIRCQTISITCENNINNICLF